MKSEGELVDGGRNEQGSQAKVAARRQALHQPRKPPVYLSKSRNASVFVVNHLFSSSYRAQTLSLSLSPSLSLSVSLPLSLSVSLSLCLSLSHSLTLSLSHSHSLSLFSLSLFPLFPLSFSLSLSLPFPPSLPLSSSLSPSIFFLLLPFSLSPRGLD